MRITALCACVLLAAAFGCKKTDKQKQEDGEAATDVPRVKTTPKARGVQVPPPESVGTIPAGAEKTASGVAFKKLKKDGDSTERPGRNDTVTVHFTSWRPDGTTQFTTSQRKRPQKMSLSTTGPGWREAMQQMTIGETWLLWMTQELAFGDKAKNAPKDILTYQVELVAVDRAPEVPADVAAVPASATKTASGLAFRVLAKGTGKDKPNHWDEVRFHFTGWTAEGLMVDSSVVRKRPRKSVLFREMLGWNEGLQTMVVGEKKRFWVPEELTKTNRWKPRGTLVYDVELLSIKRNQKPWDTPKDVTAPPANANKTDSGIAYVVLRKGTGTVKPKATDVVAVNYAGWTTDGKMFDTSILDGKPASVPVGRIMPGWSESMQSMVVGEKKRVWIPEELAYKGRPGPQGMLVFDIELLEIKEKPKPPPVPDDVNAPPADAQKTPEGIYYKVLTKGTGTVHPKATDSVVANYTGWTTDGKMFDSSLKRQRPLTFSLDGVIKGWTIGLQTMVVGQKNRFWIPEKLAYAGKKGKPKGMLVFDVELVGIK